MGIFLKSIFGARQRTCSANALMSTIARSRDKYGKSFARVRTAAYGLKSLAMTFRPAAQASNATVPDPQKGSYIVWDSRVNSDIRAPAIEDFILPI